MAAIIRVAFSAIHTFSDWLNNYQKFLYQYGILIQVFLRLSLMLLKKALPGKYKLYTIFKMTKAIIENPALYFVY